MGEHFLNHHISTNGENEQSEKFMMSLDVSPVVKMNCDDGTEESFRENDPISCLQPLTKSKKESITVAKDHDHLPYH